jgi:hypothetical protein
MDPFSMQRTLVMAPLRLFVIAPLLSVLAAEASEASQIDRRQTSVMVPDRIRFQPWDNLPSGSGEIGQAVRRL